MSGAGNFSIDLCDLTHSVPVSIPSSSSTNALTVSILGLAFAKNNTGICQEHAISLVATSSSNPCLSMPKMARESCCTASHMVSMCLTGIPQNWCTPAPPNR